MKDEELSALCPDSVLPSETGCTPDAQPQASKNNKAHSYHRPTVESVVDLSEKHNGTVKASKAEEVPPEVQCITDETCGKEGLDETDNAGHEETLQDQLHDPVKTVDQVDSPRHFSYPMDGSNHSDKSTVHGGPVKAPSSPCPLRSPLDPLCGHCHYHSTCVSAHQGCQVCHHEEHGRAFGCGHFPQTCQTSHRNITCGANGCWHRNDTSAGVPCPGRHASEQVPVSRMFSVHTASPADVSEHLQKEMDTPASPIEPGGDRDEELDAWLSGKTILPDEHDASMPVSEDCTEYGEDYQTRGVIPPYNFDLFSERAQSRGPSPFPEFSFPQGGYDDAAMGRNMRRGSIGSVNSSDSNGDGFGAVVPDYNFDLFSDVADRWNAYDDSDNGTTYHAAGYSTTGKGIAAALEDKTNRKANVNCLPYSRAAYAFGGGEKENMGVPEECGSTASALRRAFAAGMSSRVSFEITECEDDASVDSMGKKVRHIVDCEVISNPDSTSEGSRAKWSACAGANGSQTSQYESWIR